MGRRSARACSRAGQGLEPPRCRWIANRTDENIFLTLFSGLTSVADWIGSEEIYFPYVEPLRSTRPLRRAGSGSGAAGAGRPGMDGLSAASRGATFRGVVPVRPNPTQQAVEALAEKLKGRHWC